MNNKSKLYFFAPHPVQYHVGIFKNLTANEKLDFLVIYEDTMGITGSYVEEFKKNIKWDIDLLTGYNYEFLKNYSNKPHGGFFSRLNISIIGKLLFNRPDVIIFQGYTTFSDWLIFSCSNILKIKTIFRGEATLRGTEENNSFKQRVKSMILKFWLKRCDIVMYSCSGNKEFWKYYGVEESKMLPIPCAVDNDFFRSERKKYDIEEIKEELNIDVSDFVILFSARFIIRKRPLDLLQALTKIDNSNITVLFVGDGPERINMENFVREHKIKAVFVGFKNQSEISKYYSIADLDIVISDYDPSPKAMNEAMNFELPIIATDIVGTAYDLVKDGENGYIVNVGDIGAIAEKIDYLNKNRDLTKEMGKKSLEIVNDWSFDKDAYFIEEAVNKLMRLD